MIKCICDRCNKEWEVNTMLAGYFNNPEPKGQHLMITAVVDGDARPIQLCEDCEKQIYDQIFAYQYLSTKESKDKKKTTKSKEEHCFG